MNQMTNHWEAVNPDINQQIKSYYFDWSGGFAITASNHVGQVGRYVLPRLLYHVTSFVWSYLQLFCLYPSPCNDLQVQYVIQRVQPTPWPSTAVISSKETLRFQGVERKVPPAASQASLTKKGSSSHNGFCWDVQPGTHEPLVETCRNKTIMFWCVKAKRILRKCGKEEVDLMFVGWPKHKLDKCQWGIAVGVVAPHACLITCLARCQFIPHSQHYHLQPTSWMKHHPSKPNLDHKTSHNMS